VPRPAPLRSWQLDFKDVSTVPPDPDGKRGPVVEVLNTVDTGTSILLAAQVRPDFTMETAIAAVAELVRQLGLPERVTFDRDPRFVGAPQQRDFPSPFVRFWLCLGVQVTICPPRRPDLNAFVERYHRSFEYECVRIYRPPDLASATTVTARYKQFYNEQRPHQGVSCHNLPPRVAFATLPALAPIPRLVDGEAWLASIDGHCFARHADRQAQVRVAEQRYYLHAALAGRAVAVRVDAHTRAFVIEEGGQARQRLPIKGLGFGIVPFERFVAQLCVEAHTLPPRTNSAPFQQRLRI
jgi:Integrase core domain